jgi:hypothetical protein
MASIDPVITRGGAGRGGPFWLLKLNMGGRWKVYIYYLLYFAGSERAHKKLWSNIWGANMGNHESIKSPTICLFPRKIKRQEKKMLH